MEKQTAWPASESSREASSPTATWGAKEKRLHRRPQVGAPVPRPQGGEEAENRGSVGGLSGTDCVRLRVEKVLQMKSVASAAAKQSHR